MSPLPTATVTRVETSCFEPPLPVNLSLTLAPLRLGRFDPTVRLAHNEVWRASRTADGPATLHLRRCNGRINCRAFGPGATLALKGAPALVGCDDDLGGFDPAHPAVARLHHRLPGLRLGRCGRVGDVLVQTVLTQKVTAAEAMRAWGRMARRYGGSAPGPAGLLLPPDPAALASIPYYELHPLGVERRRAVTVARSCARLDRLEEAAAMSPAEADRRLTALPGLGPWSAAVIRRLAFGDTDAVEPGDYNLPHLVAWNLAGTARGDDGRMLALLAPFAGHRGRVVRLLRAGGSRPPRFGPRRRLRRVESL